METLESRQMLALDAGYTTIVDNGPSSNRVDIVFLGDGYTAAEIDTAYPTHINAMLAHFFDGTQDPFPRYESFFNVHRVDVVSEESGADDPTNGIYRDTALDASYLWDGVTDRLLYVSHSKASSALNTALDGAGFSAEMRLVAVNHTKYGGGGGYWAVYAGGNGSATEVALHELGHSFSSLADEYGSSGTYTGGEPSQANVTTSPTGDKWSDWIGYTDPDHPAMSPVGAYEGAYYKQYGIYRPTETSKMRALNQPFNAPSREKIIQDIYDLVDPLDAWLDNGGLIQAEQPALWVDTIDPAVIEVEWSVDGELVPGASGEAFALTDYGYGAGTYEVTAHAFDATEWVRTGLDALQESIVWDVEVLPAPADPPWVSDVLLAGSGWTDPFGQAIHDLGLGDADGFYRMPHDAAQLDPLPWTGMDQVRVVFSEDVAAGIGDMVLVGVNSGTVAATGFSYDASTFAATWTFPALDADKLQIQLVDTVASVATGLMLDGEYEDAIGQTVSGDSVPGGDFLFRVNILPGDVNQDTFVRSEDISATIGPLLTEAGEPGYGPLFDINGDAAVRFDDLSLVVAHFLEGLPEGEPGPSPSPTPEPPPAADLDPVALHVPPEQPLVESPVRGAMRRIDSRAWDQALLGVSREFDREKFEPPVGPILPNFDWRLLG